jgi:hypothetical protein
MKTTISDLREHLFATLEALRDEDKPMDIQRAKAIADVAQVVINSAKAETDYITATGGKVNSKFIESEPARPQLVARPVK